MSDQHNQYHQQPHHPYPVDHASHPQHYHMQPGQQPRHPIPSSASTSTATDVDSRGSSAIKRPADSLSSSSAAAMESPNVVAQTPTSAKAKKAKKASSPSDSGSVRSSGTTSAARGLRHFSMMVCQKVEEKGTTTYNEVADELVKKVVAERQQEDPNGSFDQKNIRRRVYDALNVLMAMDIISKQKKEITWKGLPTAAKQDMESMTKEIAYRESQLAQKKESLRDLLTQQVCFRNLVQRNHSKRPSQRKLGVPSETIPLPFIVVNTNKSATINCDMSGDRTNVRFDFSLPFEINDDNTILKRMGMDQANMSTLRQILPEDLLHYCEANRLTDGVLGREDTSEPHQLEVPPPQDVHQHSQQQDRGRGNISIRSGSRRLHEHHPQGQQQPPHHGYHHPQHHPSYDHHPGSRVRVPSSRHQQHPPPPYVPSSVSSSRRGMRDPYSY
mmetsp:Transcript_11487/g.29068  ORF Transcript_11487/g.29068 Transcript_11487/m.29068 type:complete len:443 (+) Transcript_11487:229-1557(+)|eukprot:CAMPEP_0116105758 /NCGR_PEP_ID=MMETSP0327-20121206/15224_1 /TAXON_ID=44447 /ORGANISM="Pseudo-nitzschia delicatissima, Strain B596" /LENGTH=442 /DNA_ID=CAMNT_0003598227 /DNA_START=211 /DNA_END=1539 /DNA_ORIENTATION=-